MRLLLPHPTINKHNMSEPTETRRVLSVVAANVTRDVLILAVFLFERGVVSTPTATGPAKNSTHGLPLQRPLP